MGNGDKERALKVGALSGLLDFYSDRSEAQASFLIACIFGLFTLLAIIQNIKNGWLVILSLIPYGMIALVGSHCLKRFGFYAVMAEKVRAKLPDYVKGEKFSIRIKGEDKELPLEKLENKVLEKYRGIPKGFKEPRYLNLATILIFGIPSVIVYVPKIYSLLVAYLEREPMFKSIGLALQGIGICVILVSHARFWYETKREYSSVRKAFFNISSRVIVTMDKKELKEASDDKLKEMEKKFPLAKLLYEDFRYSIIGVIFTLIGMIISNI